jgi:regulator of sigma E protease
MGTALAIAVAILGIMVLVVLHELGHFFAARATGMRVEKLYLFFGKPIWRTTRGETEYGIGSIPLGGYAKITGMNPEEELDPEVAPRAYCNQPVWKRIVVILAGPAVNVLIAFVILFGVGFLAEQDTELAVGKVVAGSPAEGKLHPGDRIVSVDGQTATQSDLTERAATYAGLVGEHECAGAQTDDCRAATAVQITVERNGSEVPLQITPRFDAEADRARLGFAFRTANPEPAAESIPEAASFSADRMWLVTSETASTFAQLFKAEEREKLGSVVGAVETTRQAIQLDLVTALLVIALVSLSLALINLMPILPLDGGHVFWSIVEKLRGGRRVSLRTMEQASAVGFMLILVIFAIGFTNDLDRFSNGGFDLK